jgi:hypothetical protein
MAIMPNTTNRNVLDSVFIATAGLTPWRANIKPKISHHCGLLPAYLDAITRAKPAIGRLLQELGCATVVLHKKPSGAFLLI